MGFGPNQGDQSMARKRFKPDEIVSKLRQSSTITCRTSEGLSRSASLELHPADLHSDTAQKLLENHEQKSNTAEGIGTQVIDFVKPLK